MRPDDAAAAIVVIQEIFGVNEHIRSVVDRYASFGYHAIAPALFDRVKPGVELDYDADGIAHGSRAWRARSGGSRRCATSPPPSRTSPSHRTGRHRRLLLRRAASPGCARSSCRSRPRSATTAGQIHSLNDRDPAVPTMLHFGELDHGIPLDQVDEIATPIPDVEVHVYEGAQHGFNCDARGSFHPLSAAIALGRTLDFFVANGVKP